jgi:nucleoside diphosphate kinase
VGPLEIKRESVEVNLISNITVQFDETGLRIGQRKTEKVVSARGNSSNFTGEQAESLTGIKFVSADGWVMSPWFLVKGQYHMENRLST